MNDMDLKQFGFYNYSQTQYSHTYINAIEYHLSRRIIKLTDIDYVIFWSNSV